MGGGEEKNRIEKRCRDGERKKEMERQKREEGEE